MLKNAVFSFIIFFSSFCFSQPSLESTLNKNLEEIQNLLSRIRGGSSRNQPFYLKEIRNLERENIKLQAQIAGKSPEDRQRQIKVKEKVARRREEDEGEVVQSKASRRGKKATGFNSKTGDYQYSFSGADCKVYAYRGAIKNYSLLESIMTVSLSIYEAKAPVRRLGHAAPVGFTGNIRSIAGSIICLMRGDSHPLHPVMYSNEQKHVDDENISSPYDEIEGGKDYQWRFQAGLIKPFNLLLLYKNEVGGDVGLQINNIDIISESVVTSVNDIYTEMVFQFVATNVNPISKKEKTTNE